jgi:alkylhydroperoxidase family enzyme
MMRVEPIRLEALTPEIHALVKLWSQDFGHVPEGILIMARQPDVLKANLAMVQALTQSQSIPLELKRLIGLISAITSGCHYTSALTAALLSHMGADPARWLDISNFETSPVFSDAERIALRVAQAASFTPNAVTDTDFEHLRAFYTQDQIVEIVAVVAYYGFFTRWTMTLRPHSEEGLRTMMQETGLFDHVIGAPS